MLDETIPTTLPDLTTEVLVTALRVVSEVDVSDQRALEAYDALAAAERPVSVESLLRTLAPEVFPRLFAIVTAGYLASWHKGGSTAVWQLASELSKAAPQDPSFELSVLLDTLQLLCVVQKADPEEEVRASGLAQRLSRYLFQNGRTEAAADTATLAVLLARSAGATPDPSLQRFALQLMWRLPKQVYVPLVARAKYPPARDPRLSADEALALVLDGMRRLLTLGSEGSEQEDVKRHVDALNAHARSMLADRDFVVHMSIQSEQQARVTLTRFEIRFSQRLLRRIDALIAAMSETEVSPFNFLFDLVMQLLLKRADLEPRRDEHLSYWYFLRGAEPYRKGSLLTEGVIFVRVIGEIVTAVVGELEEDIEAWTRYGLFNEMAREALHRARSLLS
jgi:hypothetical protein